MHDTDFYYNETTQSVREQQYVDFDTIGHYDNQRLVGVVNLTAVDDELPPEFVVVWGNRSAQITLQELQENKGAYIIITGFHKVEGALGFPPWNQFPLLEFH